MRLPAAQVRCLIQPPEPTITDFQCRSTSLPGFVGLPIKALHKTPWLARSSVTGPVTTRLGRSATTLHFSVRLPSIQVRRSAKSPKLQSTDLQQKTTSRPSLTELSLLALRNTPRLARSTPKPGQSQHWPTATPPRPPIWHRNRLLRRCLFRHSTRRLDRPGQDPDWAGHNNDHPAADRGITSSLDPPGQNLDRVGHNKTPPPRRKTT
jgi:hypothetical protein